MEQSVRNLAEQVKLLTVQVNNSTAAAAAAAKAPPPPTRTAQEQQQPLQPDYSMQHMRQQQIPNQSQSGFTSLPYQQPQNNWNAPQQVQPSIPPSQMTHIPPQQNPQPPQPQSQTQREDWDEVFLTNLGYQDAKELRDLLARCSPDVIMPNGQASPLSQAVVLTLIHRVGILSGDFARRNTYTISYQSSLPCR
jgi:hypothetical protein